MGEKVNIQFLIDAFAKNNALDKEKADAFVQEFFSLIEEALEKDRYVKVKGLGVFKLIAVDNRESVNINTGERFEIQGYNKISFTPETSLRDFINKPFAHFENVVLNEGVTFEDIPTEEVTEPTSPEDVSEEKMLPEHAVPLPIDAQQPEEKQPQEEILPETEKEVQEEEVSKPAEISESPEVAVSNEPNVQADAVSQESESSSTCQNHSEATTISRPEHLLHPSQEKADRKGRGKLFWAFTAGFFLCLIIMGVALCCGDWCNFTSSPAIQIHTIADADQHVPVPQSGTVIPDTVVQTDSIREKLRDTLQALPVDTLKVAKKIDAEKEKPVIMPTVKVKKKAKPFVTDSVSYDIIGTLQVYTIKEGETLTLVSLRFYGTKSLWPYLVKHNTEIIKNPDNVPHGIQIRIPKLRKKQL